MKARIGDSLQDHVNRWQNFAGTGKAVRRRAIAGEPESVQSVLEKMLVTAIQLEFSTIPPYLCALWSIKDDLHPIARSLREVVQEEMLHMGFACNMLAAIGGKVPIRELAPTYQRGLPGDVHPGLIVRLQGLNKQALEGFLRIESPVKLASTVPHENGDPTGVGSRTIGEFYQCVAAAFEKYAADGGEFDLGCQVSASLVWRVMSSVDDVKSAIGIITTQGEGSTNKDSPLDSGRDDYAHYYRFLEMWKEKRLVRINTGRGGPECYEWQSGYKLPACRPMGQVPEKGFPDADPIVLQLLYDFDRVYHEMLQLLEATWRPGGQGQLVHAISKMFELERYAKPLMEIPRPDQQNPEIPNQTYGPTFTPPKK